MRVAGWRAEACARCGPLERRATGDGRRGDQRGGGRARGKRGICALSRIWREMRSGRRVVAVPVRSYHARKALAYILDNPTTSPRSRYARVHAAVQQTRCPAQTGVQRQPQSESRRRGLRREDGGEDAFRRRRGGVRDGGRTWTREARLRDRRASTRDQIATRRSGRGQHRRPGLASPQGSPAAAGSPLCKHITPGGLERGPRETAIRPNMAAGAGGVRWPMGCEA